MCLNTYSEYKINKLMPNITLPDGNKLKFDKPVNGFDICNKISNPSQKKHL